MAIRVANDVKITVLVPNASEAERQLLPGGGSKVACQLEAGTHAPCYGIPGRIRTVRWSRDRAI